MEKVQKNRITESQSFLLCQSMPWGIIDTGFVFGATKTDKEWLSKKQKELREKEILKELEIPVGKEKITRYALTKNGIYIFLNSLDSDCPLRQLLANNDLSIRNGKKAEELLRWSKITDIQTFLYSAGVENIFTTFYACEQNPLVFGNITPFSLKTPTLAECSINIMQEYITQQNNKVKRYPSCSEENDVVLFLPNKCNPLSQVVDKTGTKIRSSNNSSGLLLDFTHKNVYITFKSNSRKTLEWRPAAYNSFSRNLSSHFKQWKFTNLGDDRSIQSAILFCETKGELEEKAKLFRKFQTPYFHVYPVLMKREGLEQIIAMINYGEEGYLRRKEREVLAKVQGSSELIGKTPRFGLEYNDYPLYVGTTIDLVAFNFLERNLKNENPIYVACYEHQKHFYTNIIGMPDEYVLVINGDRF